MAEKPVGTHYQKSFITVKGEKRFIIGGLGCQKHDNCFTCKLKDCTWGSIKRK